MSDPRLREAERRWLESSSVVVEAAYLTEQMRAGQLSHERVVLAAFLGHEAGRVSLGEGAPDPVEFAEPWSHWLLEWCERLQQFAGWDSTNYARAALAAFEASPGFNEQRDQWRALHPDDPRPEEAIASLEAFVLCPCREHDARRRAGAFYAADARRDPAVQYGPDGTDFFNGYLLAIWDATNQASLYDLLFDLAETDEDSRRLANAVSRELMPWVLGTSDSPAAHAGSFRLRRVQYNAKGALRRAPLCVT